MAMKDEILERALDLSPEDRGELVSKLQESLEMEEDDGEPVLSEEEWEEAWGEELEKRLEDLKSGRVQGVDGWEMICRAEVEIEERIRQLEQQKRR
jgi:putative addiction module component (TIGR02574 family)